MVSRPGTLRQGPQQRIRPAEHRQPIRWPFDLTPGRAPKPVEETPDDKAQRSFPDADRPIMRMNNTGWDDSGNAQASTDEAYQIILACEVTDAPNDKQQAAPMAEATVANLAQAGIEWPKDTSGQEHAIPATLDHGYESEAAVQGLEA